ncbi:MAG: Ca2+/Na+ antiporter [Mariniblastus sp.]|jgi:Ca2+/Na+ antiporter
MTAPTSPESSPGSHRTLVSSAALFLITLVLAVVFHYWRTIDSVWWIELGFVLSAATFIAVLISEACDPFSDAAQWIGCKLRLPPSVRGATLDAVASSMPELFTGLFFVVLALSGSQDQTQQLLDSAEGYGSTIATCAGSSIYNLILIPAVCAIAMSFSRPERPQIDVSREVVNRDGMWVVFVQIGLLIFLFQPRLDWWMGVVALLTYVAYVSHLYFATRKFRARLDGGEITPDDPSEKATIFFGQCQVNLNGFTSAVILICATLVAAMACYLLVELTNESARKLGVSPFFVAVILTAAVSSIPDTFMSLGSARRGDDSGAMSNVFGSNIFDICIGMSIPLIVCCYLNDWQPVELIGANGETLNGVVGLRVFLFVLTVVAMGCMWKFGRITRTTGLVFCALYGSFVTYAILGALRILTI